MTLLVISKRKLRLRSGPRETSLLVTGLLVTGLLVTGRDMAD
jgi:hypothetical protein